MMNQINIPAKSTFKQNEVCQITGVKPYVLKFWEEQFEEINPITSATGKKLYEHCDIEAIALVKQLLFDEKLSIDDAKTEIKLRLSQSAREEQPAVVEPDVVDLVPETAQMTEQAVDQQIQSDLDEFEASISKDIAEKEESVSADTKAQVTHSDLEASVKTTEPQKDLLDQVIDKPLIEKRSAKLKKSQLTDKDKQNLVLAKAKLQNMLMMTRQIKTRENLQ
jgi:DNA-binding transcriptional MerR regulator